MKSKNCLTLRPPGVTMADTKDKAAGDGKRVPYKSFTDLPVIMTVTDVAEVLGVSRNTAYEVVHSKGFPAVAIGKQIRVPKDRFVDWVQASVNA